MGKVVEHPRYSVVSLRLTEAEKDVLTGIANCRVVSISELIRDAIKPLIDSHAVAS